MNDTLAKALFTACISAPLIILLGISHEIEMNPTAAVAFWWLFVGFIIVVGPLGCEPKPKNSIRVMLFWLFAVWFDKVRDWTMEE